MKIVEIPSFFTPYGGEFCLEQSRALASLGHDVTIIANVQLSIKRSLIRYLFNDTSRKVVLTDRVKIIRNEMRGMPLAVRHNFKQWVKTVEKMFADYVKMYGKPDIIHAHCAKWAGFTADILSRKYNVPFVITEHLPSMILREELGEDGKGHWQTPLLKQTYMNADIVIPVAEELVDDISVYFGKDYKWKSISNVIDTDFYSYKQRDFSRRPFRFCCLAMYIPRKGYDVLFDAFDRLSKRCKDVELHIAGRYTDDKKCLDDRSKMLFGQNVFLYGELDKHLVRRLIHRCDCLVLASRSEAQPLVLLEAMSTGIPFIATECTPKSERINKGCHIVPIDDAEALAEKMFEVCSNYDYDGKSLRQDIVNLASPEAVGKKLESLFKDIITMK